MSIGAYIDLAGTLYARIRAAMRSGGNLEDVKKLYFGYRLDTSKQDDCPRIVINPHRIEEDYSTCTARNQIVGNVTFEVEIIYPTANSRDHNLMFSSGFLTNYSFLDANVLYDSERTTVGILYLMERFMDTINTGVDPDLGSETIDPRLSATSKRALVTNWEAIESIGDGFFRVIGYINTQTRNFTINGRVA